MLDFWSTDEKSAELDTDARSNVRDFKLQEMVTMGDDVRLTWIQCPVQNDRLEGGRRTRRMSDGLGFGGVPVLLENRFYL